MRKKRVAAVLLSMFIGLQGIAVPASDMGFQEEEILYEEESIIEEAEPESDALEEAPEEGTAAEVPEEELLEQVPAGQEDGWLLDDAEAESDLQEDPDLSVDASKEEDTLTDDDIQEDFTEPLTIEIVGQSYSSENDLPEEPSDLFLSYAEQIAKVGAAAGPGWTAGSRLTGIDKAIYDQLLPEITKVASGDRASTTFEIPPENLGLGQGTWTAAELGVPAIVVNGAISQEAIDAVFAKTDYNLNLILRALTADRPFDMYWYDKVKGVQSTSYRITAVYDYALGEYRIGVSGTISLPFSVASEYAAGAFMVDTAIGRSVRTIATKAGTIVSRYASLSDREKLVKYKEEICASVSYNDAAAAGGMAYGNPWQLIWVFDSDPSTNVVCEGYSKAFQYLCNLTEFNAEISCITVTGTMAGGTGAGAHMWNIVRMEDGKNYHVDVTNCDEGTIGAPDLLFLVKATELTADGYNIDVSRDTISYTYDSDVFSMWGPFTIASDQILGPDVVLYGEYSNVTWFLNSDGVLTIRGTGDIKDPEEVILYGSPVSDFPWKEWAGQITSLVVESGITSIPDYAFSDCTGLRQVQLPQALKEFGHDCFSNTPYLTANLANGMLIINHVLVQYAGTQNTVVVPEGVTDIGQPFYGTSVKTVVLPESLATMNNGESLLTGTENSGNITLTSIVFQGTPPETSHGEWQGFLWQNDKAVVCYPDAQPGWENCDVSWYADNNYWGTHRAVSDFFKPYCHLNGTVPVTEHTTVIDQGKDASCTEDGLTEGSHCSFCGKVFAVQQTIPSTGHNIVIDQPVAATCTSTGLTEGRHCDKCGLVLKAQETVPMVPHTEIAEPTVPPTCTSEGRTGGSICSVCRKRIKQPTILPVTPHTFGAWNTIKPATISEKGSRERTCIHCDETETEEIPVLTPTLTLSTREIAVEKDEAKRVTVTDLAAGDRVVSWGSADESIASVSSDGTITGHKPGETAVTVTLLSGLSDEVRVTVVRTLFNDVRNPADFYFDAVYWAADSGITTGYADNTFRPMNDCNRAAVVTFLWRIAGQPVPKTMATFKDMTGNQEFDTAISWAVENGITTGWLEDNTFRPWNSCNRAAIVTFLWRYAGRPEPMTMATFKDMTGTPDFDKAISWAAENGITTGYDDNTFQPWANCRRLAIVSFLYRFKNGVD